MIVYYRYVHGTSKRYVSLTNFNVIIEEINNQFGRSYDTGDTKYIVMPSVPPYNYYRISKAFNRVF